MDCIVMVRRYISRLSLFAPEFIYDRLSKLLGHSLTAVARLCLLFVWGWTNSGQSSVRPIKRPDVARAHDPYDSVWKERRTGAPTSEQCSNFTF